MRFRGSLRFSGLTAIIVVLLFACLPVSPTDKHTTMSSLRFSALRRQRPCGRVLRHPDLQDTAAMVATTLRALCRALNLPVCAHLDAFEHLWRERLR
jgi:hypothetical protein